MSWTVTTDLDRYEAWLALSLEPQLMHGAARTAFLKTLHATPAVVRSQVADLSMKELYAAVEALINNGMGGQIPWDVIKPALAGLQGCSSLQVLYRPAPTATDCDLEASAMAYELIHLEPASPHGGAPHS
jgi:hypothetical protein